MHLNSENKFEKETFIWTLRHYHRIPEREGYSFKSHIIHQRNARKVWRFFLYPSSRSDGNYMAAYFNKAYSMFDPMIYNCSVSGAGSNGIPVNSFEFPCIDLQRYSVGSDRCLRRDFIEKQSKGTVTIQCEITEVFPKLLYHTVVADFENLSLDLTALYDYPSHHDLTVRVQQTDFHLHTCVLFARCRRLCHLFGYDSFRQMPRFVQINDTCPILFQRLIRYLYSGKLENDCFPLELFRFVDKLKLQSIKQIVYEKIQEYHAQTEVSTETVTVTWNLKEIQLRDNDTVPFFQLFEIGCCMTHLAVRLGISEDCSGEKYVDVSFKVFLGKPKKPVTLVCVMTLHRNGKVRAYKKDSHYIEPDEEWHFPPFINLSEIPESDDFYIPDTCLTADVSLADGCTAYNNLHTKTRIFTKNSLGVYPERLGSDMGRLLTSKARSRFKDHDLILNAIDDSYVQAHKAILWARWPAIREDIHETNDESLSYLYLDLRSDEIKILLDYIYTGSLPFLNCFIATKLLRANATIDLPPYIVEKCRKLLYG